MSDKVQLWTILNSGWGKSQAVQPQIQKLPTDIAVFTSAIFGAAQKVCEKLVNCGFEAYIVGGSVRDVLIDLTVIPKDFDISTIAPVDEILRIFPKSGFAGVSFGVCRVKSKGFLFEVASFRKEGIYSNRRHPDTVEIGTFYEDSMRRDFTVNAIYLNPLTFEIIDFHNGFSDICAKQMRCVGNASDRLFEDPLRIVRLFRFAAGMNFKIDSSTLEAAKLQAPGLSLLSRERILMEWAKIKPGFFHNCICQLVTHIPLNYLLDMPLKTEWFFKFEKCDSTNAVFEQLHIELPASAFFLFLTLNTAVNSEKNLLTDAYNALLKWPLSQTDTAFLDIISAFYFGKFSAPLKSKSSDTPIVLQNLSFASQCFFWITILNSVNAVRADWVAGVVCTFATKLNSNPFMQQWVPILFNLNSSSLEQSWKDHVLNSIDEGPIATWTTAEFQAFVQHEKLPLPTLGALVSLQQTVCYFKNRGLTSPETDAALATKNTQALVPWAQEILKLKGLKLG